MKVSGKCSWFGGPDDMGMASDEPLAFIYEIEDQPELFLPGAIEALGRNLDPEEYYIACRWDYDETPREMLLTNKARVRSPKTGKEFPAFPADWGPHEDTDRVADLSPGLMDALGIGTDDEVEVTFPYEGIPLMPYRSIVISAGHSAKCRGAVGIIDEYDENVRVMNKTSDLLRGRGLQVKTYADTISTTQNENLNRIVDFHNSAGPHDLDVSIHFNANVETDSPMGTECLYVTQANLAAAIADSIAECGFKDRGPKKRTDLFFLNNTEEPAILIEVCFVDSTADCELYEAQFNEVCDAIADVLGGEEAQPIPPQPEVATVTITIDAPPGVNVVVHQTES